MRVFVFSGENHLIIHDEAVGLFMSIRILPLQTKKCFFHNLKQSIVLCE